MWGRQVQIKKRETITIRNGARSPVSKIIDSKNKHKINFINKLK